MLAVLGRARGDAAGCSGRGGVVGYGRMRSSWACSALRRTRCAGAVVGNVFDYVPVPEVQWVVLGWPG